VAPTLEPTVEKTERQIGGNALLISDQSAVFAEEPKVAAATEAEATSSSCRLDRHFAVSALLGSAVAALLMI
jgi:hypothetical protein